jgi:pumilio family protein 6
LIKDKLPALLASTQGLYVACACFTMLDAKDRKGVLKTLKEDIKEMFTNKMAHLFLIHILSTLDDTTLSKKKIITVSRFSDLTCVRVHIGVAEKLR